jgi:hypothetical protein
MFCVLILKFGIRFAFAFKTFLAYLDCLKIYGLVSRIYLGCSSSHRDKSHLISVTLIRPHAIVACEARATQDFQDTAEKPTTKAQRKGISACAVKREVGYHTILA